METLIEISPVIIMVCSLIIAVFAVLTGISFVLGLKLDPIKRDIAKLETSQGKLETSQGKLEISQGKLETRMGKVESRLEKLEAGQEEIKNLILRISNKT